MKQLDITPSVIFKINKTRVMPHKILLRISPTTSNHIAKRDFKELKRSAKSPPTSKVRVVLSSCPQALDSNKFLN